MKAIIYSVVTGFLICVMLAFSAQAEQRELCESMVRLHILANSDSEYDQSLKLKVRDAVCGYCRENPQASLSEITAAAQNAVTENGADYPVSSEFGVFDFPRREYSDFTLPAGKYTGVRLIIGNGAGHNWWCVMMPPLCFSGSVDGELSDEDSERLTGELSPETVSLIKSDMEVRFKVVEWINSHIG